MITSFKYKLNKYIMFNVFIKLQNNNEFIKKNITFFNINIVLFLLINRFIMI